MDLTKKRLLVTGGSGFVGRHLVERLHNAGCREVIVPRSAEFNLTREAEVRRLLLQHRPEVVFHLAAMVGGIGANRKNPATFLYGNLIMGAQLIEQCYRAGVEKFVMVGTICAYPKFTPVPFKESDLWNGYPEETNAPYGVAKKALLVGAQSYREQYGLNSIFLLPANLYGPRDTFHETNAHVIADLIRKLARGEDEVVLWGDGSPTREFLYVDDCVDGIVLAAEKYDGPEPVNLGAGKEISMRELADLVADVVGFRGKIVWDTEMPNGQPRRSIDATRAHELFGFEARTPLREGLERTVAWYREHAGAVAGAQA